MNNDTLARLLYMTYQGARTAEMDNWNELPENEKNLWRTQAEQLERLVFIGDFKIHEA